MNHIERAIEQLTSDEGTATHVYKCPADKWSIGIGRNVQKGSGPGLRESEIEFMLTNDLDQYEEELQRVFSGWDSFLPQRKATLLNLRHQLGLRGLLGFKKMVAAIDRDDWGVASAELLDSNMGRDPLLKARTNRRAQELLFG